MFNLTIKTISSKKILISILGLVLALVFIPAHFANAAWYDPLQWIWNTVSAIPLYMTLGVPILIYFITIHAAVLLSYIFYTICSLILTWVTSNLFVSLPVTSGGIVDTGLRVTTGLVNLGFILALVVIALATILRREDYGLKKLLPKFIFIVLIINFVPVICGAIIDIANIVTFSFLPSASTMGSDFLNVFGSSTPLGMIIKTFTDALSGLSGKGFNWDPILELIKKFASINGLINMGLQAASVSFFGFFAGLVVLLYAVLFIVRIIALWILVILAPIAWFCSILPNTQRLYKDWWNYFIQWSFIGAIAGFFLWLGKSLSATNIQLPQLTYTGAGGFFQALFLPIINVFNGTFVLLTSIVFLIFGFILSMKLSGSATSTVLKWGEKAGKTAGKWALARGKNWARANVPESWRATAERMAATSTSSLKSRMPGFVAAPLGMASRGLGGAFLQATTQTEEEIAQKAGGEAKKRNVAGNLSALRKAVSASERREILSAMIDQKQIKDAQDEHIVGPGNALTDNEIANAYENAKLRGKGDITKKLEQSFVNNSALLNSFESATDRATSSLGPSDQTVDGLTANDRTKYNSLAEKIVGEAKSADDIKMLGKGWYNDPSLMLTAHKFWGTSQVGEAIKISGTDFSREFQKTADNNGIDWYFDPAHPNPAIPRYLASTAAEVLGMNPLAGGETIQDVSYYAAKAKASSMAPGRDKMIAQINAWSQRLNYLRSKPVQTDAQRQEIEDRQKDVTQNLISLAGPGHDAAVAEFNSVTEQLGRLKTKQAKTDAEQHRIEQLEEDIENLSVGLGVTPATGTREHMLAQTDLMNKRMNELNELSKRAKLTAAEQQEASMIETTIKDLERRLGKPPSSKPLTPLEAKEKITGDLRKYIKRRNELNKLSFKTDLEKEELDIVESSIEDTSKKLGVEIPPIPTDWRPKLRELNERLARGEKLTQDDIALRAILYDLTEPKRNNRQGRNR